MRCVITNKVNKIKDFILKHYKIKITSYLFYRDVCYMETYNKAT